MAKKSLAVCMNTQRLSVEDRKKFNTLARDMGGEMNALQAHRDIVLSEMEELRKQLKVEKPTAPKDRPYRLIIAGSRDFENLDAIRYELNRFLRGKSIDDVAIISGTASGVDQYGEALAAELGIPVIAMPADGNKNGNAQMAKLGTHLLAGWDGTSRGTANMVKEAENNGLVVTITNGQRESVKYVDGDNSILDGALARSTPSGIVIKKDITQEELLEYLDGHEPSSKQKAAVTAYMRDEHGVELVDLINQMTPEQIQEFVLEHERSHVSHPLDSKNYRSKLSQTIAKKYGFEDLTNEMLADSAIEIEARANIDALRQMGMLPKQTSASSNIKVAKIPAAPSKEANFLGEGGFRQLVSSVKSGVAFANKTINDLIKITKSRNGVFNIPSHIFPKDSSPEQLEPFVNALASIGVEPKMANTLANRYVEYNAAYQQLRVPIEKAMEGRSDTPGLRKPQRLLERFSEQNPQTAGELPPQAVFAMMVAADSWRIQNPSDNPLLTRKDRALFMYGDQRAYVSDVDAREMDGLGIDYRYAVQDVGTLIKGILGVSPQSSELSAFTEGLNISLGAIAIEILNQDAGVTDSNVANLTIQTKVWDFGNADESGRNFEHKQSYNHIKFTTQTRTNKIEVLAHNAATAVLSGGVELENASQPLQSPAKQTVRSIRNSFGDVPKQLGRTLKALQNVEWGEADALSIVAQLAEQHKSVLHATMNVKSMSASDIKIHADAIEASNKDKIQALEEVLRARNEGWLTSFYYKYKLMNQHRIMQVGLINAQNSHFMRHMVKPKGTTTYTKDNIHMFKYAVMFNLGYKIDKKTPVDINRTFDEYTAHPDVQAAVKLLTAENLDVDAFAKVLMKLKTASNSPFKGTDISLITGLLGLAKYDKYSKAWAQHMADGKPASSFKNAFKSDIPLEIDGISNGFAINILQFPSFNTPEDLEKHLNQTGTYLARDPEGRIHLVSGIYEQEDVHTDAYLDLGSKVQAPESRSVDAAADYYTVERFWKEDRVEQLRETYDTRSKSLNAVFPDLADPEARDLVKYPFMIFLYGGGVQAIAQGVARNIITHLYQTMGELQANRSTPEGKADIDTFIAHLKVIHSNPRMDRSLDQLGNRLKMGMAQNFTFEEGPLVVAISAVIEPRFSIGLNAMLGDTKELREGVVQAAEIMHSIFMEHYEAAYAKKLKDLGRTGSLTEVEILELVKGNLKQWLPQYKGPLNDATVDSFIDLSKRVGVRDAADANRVSSFTKDLSSNDPYKAVERTNQPRNREFTTPGVSALIRGIINMDASLLSLSLEKHPEVLPLYDAVFGRPEVLMQFSEKYNTDYLKYGRETNISDIMRNQMHAMIAATKALGGGEGITETAEGKAMLLAINTRLKRDAYINTFRFDKPPLTFAALVGVVDAAADRSVAVKEDLEGLIEEKGGIGTSQLFAQDMAVTNPDAGLSVDSRIAAVKASLNVHKLKIFFSSPEVSTKVITPALRAKYDALLQRLGTDDGLAVLQGYTNEGAFEYLGLAEGDNKIIDARLKEMKQRFKDEGLTQNQVMGLLKDMLNGSDNNTSKTDEYIQEMGSAAYEVMLENLRTELRKYAKPTNFTAETTIADKAMRSFVEDLTFGTLDNQRRENPQTVFAKDITKDSVKRLFKKFQNLSRKYYPSQAAMDAHNESLSRIMDVLAKGMDHVSKLKLTLEQIDGMTQGNYDAADKRVTVSLSRDVPGARNEYSPQETYVHELLHALTVTAIADNKLIGEQIRRVRNNARKAIDKMGGYKVFLSDSLANSTPAEIALAKKQYNYLFGPEARNVPEEFLAYAVTNEAVIKALKTFDSRRPERGDGFLAQLQHIVDVILDQFLRAINKRKSTNSYEEMVAIAAQLIEIQSGHESKLDSIENVSGKYINAADSKIRKFVQDRVQQAISSNPGNIASRFSNAVIGGGIVAIGEGAGRQTATMAAYASMGDVMKHIFDEMGGGALTADLVKALLFTKVNIGKLYQQVARDAIFRLEGSWKATKPEEITLKARQAITRVVYKSDLSSLLSAGYNPAQIRMLLNSPDLIKREKAKLIKATGFKGNSDAIRYTEELGQFLVTQVSKLPDAHFNVHSIAQSFLTSEQTTTDNVRRLDAIATLTALQEHQTSDLAMVNSLMEAEMKADPKENAFQYMLEAHRAYVNVSRRDLFSGNPTQMQKGWTVDKIDNLTDVKTGTLADTKQMAREGFTLPYKLGKIPNVPQAHTHMFVAKWSPEIRHVSGILSTTGKHHSGTSLSEILAKDKAFQDSKGVPDYLAIRRKVNEVRKDQRKLAKEGKEIPDQKLRPIRDENNNIVDYRIIMDAYNVETIFEPDLEYQNVFANMNSSYISKKNTVDADKRTIDLLVDEWVGLEPSYKGKFINILDPEGEHYEKYLKLPEEVKEYMQQYSLNGEFKVRDAVIYKVFGYTAKDMSNIPGIQGELLAPLRAFMKKFHYSVRQVMAFGMERVVMATLMVLINNMVSNIYQLGIRKISPRYAVTKMAEGYKAYKRYEADTQLYRDVHHKIQLATGAQKAALERQKAALGAEIERNPVHLMSSVGLNSLIVEDVNTASTEGFIDRTQKVLQAERITKYSDKVPELVTDIAKNIVLAKSSFVYRKHKEVVQLTDFLSRYAMISHAVDVKGQSFDVALQESIDAFVLFDENMHPWLETINSLGFTAFLSYKLRNTRSAASMIQKSPTMVMTAAGLQSVTGLDTLANINGSVFVGDLLPHLFQQDELFDSATTIHGLENALDISPFD